MEWNSCQIEKAHQRHQQWQKQFTHPNSIQLNVDFQRLAAESLQAWIYTKFHVWRKFKVCSFSPFCNPSTYTLLFSQLPPSYIEIIQVPSKPMLANLSFPRAKIRYSRLTVRNWSAAAGLICPSPIWTHDEVWAVSGLNATDKTPMYEMPLIYVFGVWRLGLGWALFVVGFWAMAFCHWRFVPRLVWASLEVGATTKLSNNIYLKYSGYSVLNHAQELKLSNPFIRFTCAMYVHAHAKLLFPKWNTVHSCLLKASLTIWHSTAQILAENPGIKTNIM